MSDDRSYGAKDRALASREEVRRRRGDRPELLTAADRSSNPCAGWYVAADLCFQHAIKAADDATFDTWAEMGEACLTMGDLCENFNPL